MKKYDLIIIGGGIIGTFCAYHALRKNKSVLLLEKDSEPYEASFRNFGQAVPSGQALDTWFEHGRRSLKIYKRIQDEIDISLVKNGSWYLASDDFEMTLLEEMQILFAERNYIGRLYQANDCLDINPALQKSYVKGGLFIPEEASLNPRVMVHRLRSYLISKLGLHYKNQTTIVGAEKKRGIVKINSAAGETFWGDKLIIANGKDTQFLLPNHYPEKDLKISKLQMLLLAPQKRIIHANILTGLTIRRYESFHSCPSFSKIETTAEQKLLQSKGIHILFKQADDGSIILGDSHEYKPVHQQAGFGFDISTEINDMMLEEAKEILRLEHWNVEKSWAGFYLQGTESQVFTKTIDDVLHVVNGIGGKGMTTSPGFTEQYIDQLYH